MIVKADVGGETYTMREIVDFAVESRLVSGEDFEIGTVIISQLIIKMRLNGEVPVNTRIIPYIAFDPRSLTWEQVTIPWDEMEEPWDGSNPEWIPLGEFYIDSRTRDNDIWRFVCLDKLVWSTQSYVSNLTYPSSMQAVWDEICSHLGYISHASVQIDPGYMIETKPEGFTYRQVMGWIAGANSASVWSGKDGTIRFKRYAAVQGAPDLVMTESDYVRCKQTNPLKTYSRFVVTYDDEQDLKWEAGSGGEDATLYMENPFMTQEMVDALEANLGGFTYQPMEMDARGYPHVDIGDEMEYGVYEGSTWETTVTPWQDTQLPWDGITEHRTVILWLQMRFAGGMRMILDAPGKSDSQSEFSFAGPITTAVKNLNQTAVKLKRNYYGVSTSREEGLVVDRDDGLAKAIFNADEMRFIADGQDALWFDIPNRRFKFSGTLEGVDGVFSGSLIGGDITIGSGNNVFRADTAGIWAGHANFSSAPFRVNMAGQMEAVGAKFSGEITASSITGGDITGARIQTKSTGVYPRIQIDSALNLLSAEYSATNTIKINPTIPPSPTLDFESDLVYGIVGVANDTFLISTVFGEGDLQLNSGQDLELYAANDVKVQSWFKLKNNSTGQNLQQALDSKAASFSGLTGVVPPGSSLVVNNGVVVGIA